MKQIFTWSIILDYRVNGEIKEYEYIIKADCADDAISQAKSMCKHRIICATAQVIN